MLDFEWTCLKQKNVKYHKSKEWGELVRLIYAKESFSRRDRLKEWLGIPKSSEGFWSLKDLMNRLLFDKGGGGLTGLVTLVFPDVEHFELGLNTEYATLLKQLF